MEKLANEGIVQLGLPLLNEGKLEATKIGSASEKRDWGPDEHVAVFVPKPKGQFRLNQAGVGELVVLAYTTVFPIHDVV